MDYESFRSWLDAYGRAWEARDPEALAALYAEDATYQEDPFDEPMRGRPTIQAYASEAGRTQEQISFRYDILAITQDVGISRWWASFTRVPSKVRVKLDGVFVVTFDAHNLCTEFREWWHRREIKPED
jgi:hypothetical protein